MGYCASHRETAERAARGVAMVIAGETPEVVAEELGVSSRTVRQWLTNAGEPPPRSRAATAPKSVPARENVARIASDVERLLNTDEAAWQRFEALMAGRSTWALNRTINRAYVQGMVEL